MTKEEQRKMDESYMRRALQLALCGREHAAPNPMVGAVVVCDGRIVGEGFHRQCGGPHAEVNAIASVRRPEQLEHSTLYVTLEPCAHYGKTPPCAKLIIEKHIPRVVVGCRDSFEKVDGKGISMLRQAGVEVTVGVLEKECLELNRQFFTFHQKKRPYVTLKWAESADGMVDFLRSSLADGPATQLSDATNQTLVHRLRSRADAILVGGRTALLDNPSLTTRRWPGRSPQRVVIDTHGNLPADLRLFPARVYLTATDARPDYERLPGTAVCRIAREPSGALPLHAILSDLAQAGVQSLLVEGGPAIHQAFLEQRLWDEIRVEHSPRRLGGGVAAAHPLGAVVVARENIGGHVVEILRPGCG